MLSTGRKLFQKNLQQYQPADPLYETYVDKKGRERRRKVGSRADIWNWARVLTRS